MEKSAVRVAQEQAVALNKLEKLYPIWAKIILNPSNGYTLPKLESMKYYKKQQLIRAPQQQAPIKYRPLKLVYDHDIRHAQMPVNSSFKILRAVVRKCFPMLKTVLIKYKDADGDSMNVMSSSQLRIVESFVDNVISKEPDNEGTRISTFSMLRLHIVQVNPIQEPSLFEIEEEEEEIEEVKPEDEPECKEVETDDWLFDFAQIFLTHVGIHTDSHIDLQKVGIELCSKALTEFEEMETQDSEDEPECKGVEMDDWLFDFAQIFLTHVGIDPDSHIDLQKVGMELCSEALKETVTSEHAQTLFDKAASKFKEMAAVAFYNCGNVHMCAAKRRNLIDEAGPKETVDAQLNNAYNWLEEKYTLAEEKYKEALLMKPDFYKALFALGQKQFEMAKLDWSFVLVKKIDLSKWDPTNMFLLFYSADKKTRAATKMWEKMEEQRANESKQGKKDEVSKKNNQIHLFWGILLFQMSQIECFLGLSGWNKNLVAAEEKFKLAGVSEPVISMVLKNHCWNWNEEEKV